MQVTQKLFPFSTRQNLNSAQLTFQITTNTQHYLYGKIKVACKCKCVIFIFPSGAQEVYTTPLRRPPAPMVLISCCTSVTTLSSSTTNWVNKLTHAADPPTPLSYYFQSTSVHNHRHNRATGRRQQRKNDSGNDGTQE